MKNKIAFVLAVLSVFHFPVSTFAQGPRLLPGMEGTISVVLTGGDPPQLSAPQLQNETNFILTVTGAPPTASSVF